MQVLDEAGTVRKSGRFGLVHVALRMRSILVRSILERSILRSLVSMSPESYRIGVDTRESQNWCWCCTECAVCSYLISRHK